MKESRHELLKSPPALEAIGMGSRMTDQRLRTYQGATAIVTGGASGIGRSLAEELARRGASVVVADLQSELAEEVAASIRTSGGQAEARMLDVRDFDAVSLLVNQTARSAGRLDFVFNNAGIAVLGDARHYELRDWNQVIDVNLRGVIHGIQAAYPIMLRQGFGHLVNTASIAGLFPLTGLMSYCATKHAVVGLSNALRVEAGEAGVRVSVLCPGAVDTAIGSNGGHFGRSLHDHPPEVEQKIWRLANPISPALFARKALDAVARNRPIIVIPEAWKWLWNMYRFSPSWALRWSRNHYRSNRQLADRLTADLKQTPDS